MGASLSPNEANLFKLIVLFCKLEQDWKFPNSHIERGWTTRSTMVVVQRDRW
ncbi:hypothetical protein AAZX31_03G115200 [Glycine max]